MTGLCCTTTVFHQALTLFANRQPSLAHLISILSVPARLLHAFDRKATVPACCRDQVASGEVEAGRDVQRQAALQKSLDAGEAAQQEV